MISFVPAAGASVGVYVRARAHTRFWWPFDSTFSPLFRAVRQETRDTSARHIARRNCQIHIGNAQEVIRSHPRKSVSEKTIGSRSLLFAHPVGGYFSQSSLSSGTAGCFVILHATHMIFFLYIVVPPIKKIKEKRKDFYKSQHYKYIDVKRFICWKHISSRLTASISGSIKLSFAIIREMYNWRKSISRETVKSRFFPRTGFNPGLYRQDKCGGSTCEASWPPRLMVNLIIESLSDPEARRWWHVSFRLNIYTHTYRVFRRRHTDILLLPIVSQFTRASSQFVANCALEGAIKGYQGSKFPLRSASYKF